MLKYDIFFDASYISIYWLIRYLNTYLLRSNIWIRKNSNINVRLLMSWSIIITFRASEVVWWRVGYTQ